MSEMCDWSVANGPLPNLIETVGSQSSGSRRVANDVDIFSLKF